MLHPWRRRNFFALLFFFKKSHFRKDSFIFFNDNIKELTSMIFLTPHMRNPPSRPTAAGARPRPGQYPGEAEVTFPPFTCLEADGEARLERTKDGEVVIFPLKVT